MCDARSAKEFCKSKEKGKLASIGWTLAQYYEIRPPAVHNFNYLEELNLNCFIRNFGWFSDERGVVRDFMWPKPFFKSCFNFVSKCLINNWHFGIYLKSLIFKIKCKHFGFN